MRSKYVLGFIKIILQVVFISRVVICLRNVRMVIPQGAERGKPVAIKCMYDLEREQLYQVKWYRGNREFCRYTPREIPPLNVFPIYGIEVDRQASNSEKVTIRPTALMAQGQYTCEVSADAPTFITAQVKGAMYVVDLPKEIPDIIGFQNFYKPGIKLKVECISRDSMPAANLSFQVNEKRAPSRYVRHRVSVSRNGKMWTAYSTIEFVVRKHHFFEERLKIRCAAVIYDVYYKSHQKSAIEIKIPTTTTPEPETKQPYQKYPNCKITGTQSSGGDAIGDLLTVRVTILYLYIIVAI